MENKFKERIINSIEELEESYEILIELESELSNFIYDNYRCDYAEKFDKSLFTIIRLLEESIDYGKCNN